jgi:hypothetical protein
MKKTLIVLALVASFGASAQDLSATSGATSRSQAGAQSGSIAAGNVIVLEQNVPETQHIVYENKSNSTATLNENNNSNVHYSGTTTVKNVPGIAMSGPASGPCTGASGGLGLAGPGWGVGFNGAKVEQSCVVRENVRVIGMAMQSLDGTAYPQQKGEALVMFMDALKGLAAMNNQILIENKAK